MKSSGLEQRLEVLAKEHIETREKRFAQKNFGHIFRCATYGGIIGYAIGKMQIDAGGQFQYHFSAANGAFQVLASQIPYFACLWANHWWTSGKSEDEQLLEERVDIRVQAENTDHPWSDRLGMMCGFGFVSGMTAIAAQHMGVYINPNICLIASAFIGLSEASLRSTKGKKYALFLNGADEYKT